MKKQLLRVAGFLLACTVAVVSIPSTGAFAEETDASETYELSLRTTDDRRSSSCIISSLDTAENDVTVKVGMYINSEDWDPEHYIEIISARWEATAAVDGAILSQNSTLKCVQFSNVSDILAMGKTQTVTYSGGTYQSRYEPYCLAQIVTVDDQSRELDRSSSLNVTTLDYAFDPIFGSVVYTADNQQVRFSARYYESQEDKNADLAEKTTTRKKLHRYYCDIKYNSEGIPYYTFDYIDQYSFEQQEAVGLLPCYDSSMAANKPVPGMSNFFQWVYTGSTPTQFLGASDEFPLITFDITLKKGTPEGAYYIDFVDNETSASMGGGNTFISGRNLPVSYPDADRLNGFTIYVNEDAPRITTETSTETTTTTTTTTTESESLTTESETTESVEETTALTEETTDTTEVAFTETEETTTETTSETAPVSTEETTTETTPPETTTETTTTRYDPEVYLEPKQSMTERDTAILKLYNLPSDASVVWISSATDIVTVLDSEKTYSLIYAKHPGKATVYALVSGKVYSCEVAVSEKMRVEIELCGDVNCDGNITLADVVFLGHYLIDRVQLSDVAVKNADCNGNGTVESADAAALMKFLIHMVDALPLESTE